MNKRQRQEFWGKVDVRGKDECWEWQWSTNNAGYGAHTTGGSHRRALSLATGGEMEGFDAMHSCDNRLCCNPHHLRWGTRAENLKDAVAKGYQPYRKITPRDRRWIRKAYAAGFGTHKEIGEMFNITRSRVGQIIHRIPVACLALLMVLPAFAGQHGLQEGVDWWYAPADVEVTPAVPSVLMTRAAMDRLLNELAFEKEKRQAAEAALVSAQQMIEARDSLEFLIAEQEKDQWWMRALTAGAAGLGGFIAGQQMNDTTVILR